jgi:hypothetical protein
MKLRGLTTALACAAFLGHLVIASLTVALLVVAVPAYAYQCPTDMAKIDAVLAKNPRLSAGDLARVRQLRAEGEALHRSGKTQEAHSAAVAKFSQAKRILGIK